jgi:F420H(2)-dependent quinone reductase
VQAFDVVAQELPADERAALFDKVTAVAPGFAEYQAKTTRVIPLFELNRT